MCDGGMYHISIKESKENQSLGEYKATRSTSSPLTPEKLNIWFPQCRSFTWSACPYVKIKPSQTAMLYRSFGQKFWGSFSQLVRKLFYEHWGPSKEYHLRNKEKNYNCLKKHFFFCISIIHYSQMPYLFPLCHPDPRQLMSLRKFYSWARFP